MNRFCLVTAIASTLLSVLSANGEDVQPDHRRLWSRYESVLPAAGIATSRHGLVFLPFHEFHADAKSTVAQEADEYARQLIRLARSKIGKDSPLAFQLLHEAAYFGQDNLADKIVNGKSVQPKSRRSTTSHPRLKWKRREYFRVSSEHYQIVCRNEQAGLEIASRLESLHAVWRQLFFEWWSGEARLKAALEKGKLLQPRTRRLHRVVLFSSQQEYTEFLRKSQPRIGITKGFYDISARTSYFFAAPDKSNHSTQFHEATHQLFQETQKASERVALTNDFWVIEGVAMYMESLRVDGPIAQVGGVGASRLQFARYRRLQEGYYVPLKEFLTYGRSQIQQDTDIRRVYTQSAGLAHLLMDYGGGQYRDGFVQYLKAIYQGRNVSLGDSLQVSLETLDQQYEEFLRIDDTSLHSQDVPADSLESLCLGRTRVTNTGLKKLTRQANLKWLDLASTPVQRSGLAFIADTKSLRQVSFDQCAYVDDDVLKLIGQNRDLEELDLTATAITDRGLKHLAGLTRLKTLWVGNTKLTDASVPILVNLRALTTLSCENTNISKEGLQAIAAKSPNLNIEK